MHYLKSPYPSIYEILTTTNSNNELNN